MEENTNTEKKIHHPYWCGCCGGRGGFGWFLVILGALWLASEAGWIPGGISFWPIVFIAFGAYLLLKRRGKTCC